MYIWLHSGGQCADGRLGGPLRVPEEGRAFSSRPAGSCARNSIVRERLTYDRAVRAVMYRSDKFEGHGRWA